MNLQYFAAGEDYDVNSMADLDSLLDGGQDDKDDDTQDDGADQDDDGDGTDDINDSDDNTGDDDSDNGSDNGDDDTSDDDDDADSDDNDDQAKDDKGESKKQTKDKPKDNKAFAAMRAENSAVKKQLQAQSELIKQIALGLGLDAGSKDLMSDLGDIALKGRAKRENKSPSELAKDAKLAEYQQKEIQTHTYSEIAAIKNELGASDDEIRSFIQETMQAGHDPFKSKVELKAKYISAHFEDIVQKRVDTAVEEALKRRKAADEKSGKSKKNGKNSNGKKDIQTMAELNAYLDSLD